MESCDTSRNSALENSTITSPGRVRDCTKWSSSLYLSFPLSLPRPLSLSLSLSLCACRPGALSNRCRFNKCPWRVVGKGTNRLEPQTQCLVMVSDGFVQCPPALPVPGSARDTHSLCSLAVPAWAARALVQRDLISAQIVEQTTLINPARSPGHC